MPQGPQTRRFRPRTQFTRYRAVGAAAGVDAYDAPKRAPYEKVGSFYGYEKGFTGRETAIADSLTALSKRTRIYKRHAFQVPVPRPEAMQDSAIGESPIGENPIGGEVPGSGNPTNTVGLPVGRGEVVKHETTGQYWKVVSVLALDTVPKLDELTVTATEAVTITP